MASSSAHSFYGAAWDLPEIVDYFLEDNNIAGELAATDIESVINYTFERDQVKRLLEYQDFGPRAILDKLIRNKKLYDAQNPSHMMWDLSNVGDDLVKTLDSKPEHMYSNHESLARDVNFLITLYLSTYDDIGQILYKSRGRFSLFLQCLQEKYTIKDEFSECSIARRTITLPRIASVFPATAVRIFHKNVAKEIVSYDSFPGSHKPETHAICCPLLPSVAPIDLMNTSENNFHPVMIWTAIRLDDIIHRRDTPTGLMDILSNYRTKFQSSATPRGARVKVFEYIGLVDTTTTDGRKTIKLTPAAKNLASACLNQLTMMRRQDDNHALMFEVAKSGNLHSF